MANTVSYNQLTIHERINLRSGFDVAITREMNKETCRIKQCANSQINRNGCQREYDIDRFYSSSRTWAGHRN